MQLTHDSNAVLSISVNPFLRCITIEHLPSSKFDVWNYGTKLDVWRTYEFENEEFDIHFYYNKRMEVYAYRVIDGFNHVVPINLSIEF